MPGRAPGWIVRVLLWQWLARRRRGTEDAAESVGGGTHNERGVVADGATDA
jgi:hypothetical protein